MNIAVVYNTNSGSEDSLADIKQAFQTHNVEPTYVPIDRIDDKLPSLLRRPHLTVVAAGGDGTINSVVGHIIDTDATLAVIPSGTLNHFARELGIPLETADAVKVALGNTQTQVDIGIVNGHVFLNNSSIGWYPRSLRAREELDSHIGKWPAALVGSLKAALNPRRYHVELTIDGKHVAYRTPFVFIGNNSYKRANPNIGQRETLQGGQLAIYIVKAQNFVGILRMLAVGLFTKKRRTQDFATYKASECIISTRHHRTLHVACDGEVLDLPVPLNYRSKPSSLRVLIP